MENKVYFTVQDIKKIPLGHKMYTHEILKATLYTEDELQKAIRHYQKRKSNQIIMTRVKYLDRAPYVKETIDFGEEVWGEYENGHFKKYIVFYKFDVKYEI
jgi:hypothetical protein